MQTKTLKGGKVGIFVCMVQQKDIPIYLFNPILKKAQYRTVIQEKNS